jgi:hypothetical protein
MRTQVAGSVLDFSDGILDRMKRASDKVEDRLDRLTALLNAANVPYAIVGGNAVAAWVATVDESAVRMTRNVDVMIRRVDLDQLIDLMGSNGFRYRHSAGVHMFLDGPDVGARDAVHVVFSEESIPKDNPPIPTPSITEVKTLGGVKYVDLNALVLIKLTAWRRKDQVHLLDLIGVGLVTSEHLNGLPPILQDRLQELLNDPEG